MTSSSTCSIAAAHRLFWRSARFQTFALREMTREQGPTESAGHRQRPHGAAASQTAAGRPDCGHEAR